MPKKKQTTKQKKLTSDKVARILTLILLVIFMINVAMYFIPECPAYYTQAQVDDSFCTIGANIGVGLMAVLITIPFAIFVTGFWLVKFVLKLIPKK